AVPDRDLARVAGEDVEAEHRDEEDPDLGGEIDVVVAEDEREHAEHGRDDEQRGEHRNLSFHTRRTSRRPKSPVGLTRRIRRRTAKAKGVWSSDPMYFCS